MYKPVASKKDQNITIWEIMNNTPSTGRAAHAEINVE